MYCNSIFINFAIIHCNYFVFSPRFEFLITPCNFKDITTPLSLNFNNRFNPR